jgi:hypothetical protein
VALACLPFLFPNIKKQAFIALLLILPPLLSLCFYLIYPHIFAYAGFLGSSWSICILCNRQFKRKVCQNEILPYCIVMHPAKLHGNIFLVTTN